MKIYTRTGDDGTTGLLGGSRVSKSSRRIAAIGDVDELNAAVGMARSIAAGSDNDAVLASIQSRLFDVGAELASPDQQRIAGASIEESDIEILEHSIDRLTSTLEPLKNFILPGGSPLSAALHVARSVCRRAERAIVELNEQEAVRGDVCRYLNRLSDWLFVAARAANADGGIADVPWARKSL